MLLKPDWCVAKRTLELQYCEHVEQAAIDGLANGYIDRHTCPRAKYLEPCSC